MVRMDVVVQLEDLAEWFDNPRLSKFCVAKIGGQSYTAGYLLRAIALSLEGQK